MQKICSQEAAVTRAARSGQWSDELQAHAVGCTVCKEIVQTVLAMQSLAAPAAMTSRLPDAELLWRRALLAAKQAEVRRTQRPLRIAEYASCVVIALAFGGWLAWYWPAWQPQFSGWQASVAPQVLQLSWFLLGPSQGLSATTAALVIAAALAAYPLLAED
jgi:hypothetical protein